MKNFLLSVGLMIVSLYVVAQKPIMYDSLFHFDSNGSRIETPITFDFNDSADQDFFMIDTTQGNNIWQYAKVNKQGFSQLNTIALTTDSVANYPVSDTSSFMFNIIFSTMNTTLHDFISLGITLHHKYQTDSLHDGLRFESYNFLDHKWESFFSIASGSGNYYLFLNIDSSYNWGDGFYLEDPLSGNHPQFHYSRLAFGMLGVKGSPDSVLLRFTFVSDSINTNKEGWLIDKITIEANMFTTSGFSECKLAQNDYLAYLDGNRLFINSLLIENREADFTLFDMLGREVLIDEVHYGLNSIDVANMPKGYYIVKVKNQAGVFTKKIFIGQ